MADIDHIAIKQGWVLGVVTKPADRSITLLIHMRSTLVQGQSLHQIRLPLDNISHWRFLLTTPVSASLYPRSRLSSIEKRTFRVGTSSSFRRSLVVTSFRGHKSLLERRIARDND